MSSITRYFKRISAALDSAVPSAIAADDIERVSAMLLVEIARADHSVDADEHRIILDALSSASSLERQELVDIVNDAMEDSQAMLSLHDHITTINAKFAKEDKKLLVEQMWRVAIADGDIDRYEDYTIRKLCDLIYVKHRDFIQAKHKVLSESTG